MNYQIDKQRAIKKWTPILENLGVKDQERIEWMSEMAEYQNYRNAINENAYVNASNVAGMGAVVSAQPSTFAGGLGAGYTTGTNGVGSGDVGQNLLPVSMKIAGQTIGLDLVAVKPSAGPKIDLLFLDFQYDNTQMGDEDERPQVFKFTDNDAALQATLITNIKNAMLANAITEKVGGLNGGRLFLSINANATLPSSSVIPADKEGVVEFLGFSRIDGYPMFRAFRQANTSHTAVNTASTTWGFDQTRNTFGPTGSMTSQMTAIAVTGATTSSVTLSAGKTIELVSTMEDQIPGFVTNWAEGPTKAGVGSYPMNRQQDDNTYAGVIAPQMSSKSVQIGTIEVSSALRLTEIEDIKANTGIDIVQKMEAVLVNELSQTISKQIVDKIFEMGDLNRASAPKALNGVDSRFDLDTAYATGPTAPGGETTHAIQRKLITKVLHASTYIATDGRVGPAQFLVTNGGLAAAFMDIAGYTLNPSKNKLNGPGQLYPVGQIGDITIYVDPYQRFDDNRIVLGRKNNADMPGVIFIPYLMAQSIGVTSEATFAPRLLLRSRYAITSVGFFPHKQYMTIVVKDANQYLN